MSGEGWGDWHATDDDTDDGPTIYSGETAERWPPRSTSWDEPSVSLADIDPSLPIVWPRNR